MTAEQAAAWAVALVSGANPNSATFEHPVQHLEAHGFRAEFGSTARYVNQKMMLWEHPWVIEHNANTEDPLGKIFCTLYAPDDTGSPLFFIGGMMGNTVHYDIWPPDGDLPAGTLEQGGNGVPIAAVERTPDETR